MNAGDTVNGMAVVPFEQKIAEAHERIMQAATEAIDAELERLLLPVDRVAMLQGFAKFACYYAAVKVADVQTQLGTPMAKTAALNAWHKIGKQIDKEVPSMLLEFGREAVARQVQGAGE